MYNNTEDIIRSIKINNIDYILKTSFSITGPYISIRDKNNVIELANIVLYRYKDNIYIFDIKVHNDQFRNKGIGARLMQEAAKWCHERKISILFGKLDGEDKDRGFWKTSLHFYNKLSNKTKYIRKSYFLPYLCDITDIDSFEKNSQSLEYTLINGGNIVFIIA